MTMLILFSSSLKLNSKFREEEREKGKIEYFQPI